MFVRRFRRHRAGNDHCYWGLVETYRTERGPRQRLVTYLGKDDEAGGLGLKVALDGSSGWWQPALEGFEGPRPRWVEVDWSRVRLERSKEFGGAWLGLEVARRLGLPELLDELVGCGREDVPWSSMALVLVLARLLDPSSELRLAETVYDRTAMSDLLGVPSEKVNDDRLYRALDALLPHKAAMEKRLSDRLGRLFGIEYDLLLYDVTSTYFEGPAERNPKAQRGYSRDHRPDCKQVCIGLVVSRCGLPLGYEVFEGNRHDGTTLGEMVTRIEAMYGRADRIWVMDRGMVSEENLGFLRESGRRYIVGTPRSQLRRYERQLLADDWATVHAGLDVRSCPADHPEETFILCRSAQRREKELAMSARFEERIEEGMAAIARECKRRRLTPAAVGEKVGRLLANNTRAARLFDYRVVTGADNAARLEWRRTDASRDWVRLSAGCYMLRTNVTDWSPDDLWRAYIQLTQAEDAFRIHKSDLKIRPVWHQRADRVAAHILVCFLAFVLWKALGQMARAAGLGDEPRQILDELSAIRMADVVADTRDGRQIRKRCIVQPTRHQAILINRLRLDLPSHLPITQM
ncbi:MAG: IS1634 family transposase [Acidobacteria bacterium]|nr:IS1634 family transposase [Acidobacteriota bacterium]